MIVLEKTEVYNFQGALRGLRNPLDSWDKSDSIIKGGNFILGQEDLKLAQRMVKAGTDESKFLRQIFVSVDIKAPLYWWKEADTYKVATTANSCSTMHTLDKAPITLENFSFDNEIPDEDSYWEIIKNYISCLEELRKLSKTNKKYWRGLIQALPDSWEQKRTWTGNYQNLRNIYFARRNHKLTEWKDFCRWIEQLPYGKELICFE